MKGALAIVSCAFTITICALYMLLDVFWVFFKANFFLYFFVNEIKNSWKNRNFTKKIPEFIHCSLHPVSLPKMDYVCSLEVILNWKSNMPGLHSSNFFAPALAVHRFRCLSFSRVISQPEAQSSPPAPLRNRHFFRARHHTFLRTSLARTHPFRCFWPGWLTDWQALVVVVSCWFRENVFGENENCPLPMGGGFSQSWTKKNSNPQRVLLEGKLTRFGVFFGILLFFWVLWTRVRVLSTARCTVEGAQIKMSTWSPRFARKSD